MCGVLHLSFCALQVASVVSARTQYFPSLAHDADFVQSGGETCEIGKVTCLSNPVLADHVFESFPSSFCQILLCTFSIFSCMSLAHRRRGLSRMFGAALLRLLSNL